MNDDLSDLRSRIIRHYLRNEFSPDLEREIRQWLMDAGMTGKDGDEASLEFWNELAAVDATDEDTERIWGKIIREYSESHAGCEGEPGCSEKNAGCEGEPGCSEKNPGCEGEPGYEGNP